MRAIGLFVDSQRFGLVFEFFRHLQMSAVSLDSQFEPVIGKPGHDEGVRSPDWAIEMTMFAPGPYPFEAA
jgi:hypothetical protein